MIADKNRLLFREAKDGNFYCSGISLYSEGWFNSRCFICGDSTKDIFNRLLGLAEADAPVLITIAWKGYFEIELLDKHGGDPFIIVVKKYKSDEKQLYSRYESVILKNNFVVIFKKGDLSAAIARIIHNLTDNLEAVRPADIFSVVYEDNNTFLRASAVMHPENNDPASSYSSFYAWGNGKMGYTFMLDYSRMLDPDHWIGFSSARSIFLRRGDVECNISESPLNFRTCGKEYAIPAGGLFQTFRDKSTVRGRAAFEKVVLRCAVLDLTDEDIIMGADKKLYGILDKITQKENIPVNILHTCVSKIIGSDMSSLVKELNKKNNAHIVYSECSSDKYPIVEFVDLMRRVGLVKKHKSAKKTFNLVGYRNNPGIVELSGILKDFFGIGLNIMFLPKVDLKALKRFPDGNLTVLSQAEIYNGIFCEVFGDSDEDVIRPLLPFGMKQSIAWLRSVTSFFRVPVNGNNKWKEYFRQRRLKWRSLTKQADKFKLGFIISGDDIELLAEPVKYPFGVPLLRCLEEMGFGLNILITSRHNFDEQKEILSDLFLNKKKHRIELLNYPQKLDEWISGSECRCIYSDLHNDTRVISNGKIPFSVFIFEEGVDGAIRTLESLLALCRIELFSTHRKYNQRPRPVIFS